jgi:leader peptidase (prepilin peptidase)/N-methyltransferase
MNTRHTFTATIGATVFAAAGLAKGDGAVAIARLAVLGAALATVAIYDVEQRRIPNRIVLPASAACASLTLAADASVTSLVAGAAVVVSLLVVSLVWPQALGIGDVKLALLLVLGLDGSALRALAVGTVFAALAAAVMLARRGVAAWRASLPLAPFFAAGALVSLLPWPA